MTRSAEVGLDFLCPEFTGRISDFKQCCRRYFQVGEKNPNFELNYDASFKHFLHQDVIILHQHSNINTSAWRNVKFSFLMN